MFCDLLLQSVWPKVAVSGQFARVMVVVKSMPSKHESISQGQAAQLFEGLGFRV
jgi:hypothetical protein